MLPAGPRGGASTPTSQSRRDATGRHGDSGVGRESRHGDSCAVDASHAVLTCGRETDATAATAATASRARATRSRGAERADATAPRLLPPGGREPRGLVVRQRGRRDGRHGDCDVAGASHRLGVSGLSPRTWGSLRGHVERPVSARRSMQCTEWAWCDRARSPSTLSIRVRREETANAPGRPEGRCEHGALAITPGATGATAALVHLVLRRRSERGVCSV